MMPNVIGIDFDGTVVTHDYPKVGKDIGAQEVLKKLVANNNKLVLNTMRSGKELKDAEDWFAINNIPLYGLNVNPTQKNWTKSPKVHANLYIDDLGLNTPLKFDSNLSDRPFVDWVKIEEWLYYKGWLKPEDDVNYEFSKVDSYFNPQCKIYSKVDDFDDWVLLSNDFPKRKQYLVEISPYPQAILLNTIFQWKAPLVITTTKGNNISRNLVNLRNYEISILNDKDYMIDKFLIKVKDE